MTYDVCVCVLEDGVAKEGIQGLAGGVQVKESIRSEEDEDERIRKKMEKKKEKKKEKEIENCEKDEGGGTNTHIFIQEQTGLGTMNGIVRRI